MWYHFGLWRKIKYEQANLGKLFEILVFKLKDISMINLLSQNSV